MKFSGVMSIIIAMFIFVIACTITDTVSNPDDALFSVSMLFIFLSIYLLIDGIAKIRTANRLRNLEQKFLYVSGLAGSDYLGDR